MSLETRKTSFGRCRTPRDQPPTRWRRPSCVRRAGLASRRVPFSRSGLSHIPGPHTPNSEASWDSGVTSNSSEMTPGFGGTRGNGAMPIPGPVPFIGGLERQGQGRRPQREADVPNGGRRLPNSPNLPGLNPGQQYQPGDWVWYGPDGRPYTVPQPGMNAGQPYQAQDGKWYYPERAALYTYPAGRECGPAVPGRGRQLVLPGRSALHHAPPPSRPRTRASRIRHGRQLVLPGRPALHHHHRRLSQSHHLDHCGDPPPRP